MTRFYTLLSFEINLKHTQDSGPGGKIRLYQHFQSLPLQTLLFIYSLQLHLWLRDEGRERKRDYHKADGLSAV